VQLYSSMTATLEGGEWSAARPGRTSPFGNDPVPILQEAGWAPGPVWTGGKSRPHRDSIPDRQARSSVTIPTELPDPLIRCIRWVGGSAPRPGHLYPRKDPVPILQEDGWALGPVWTGGKSRPHRDSIPDHPARSSITIPTELPGPLIRCMKYIKNINKSSLVL